MGIGTFVLCLFVFANVVKAGDVVVTDQVYFDIAVDDISAGRIVIGLFGEEVPKTVKNFVTLATSGLDGKTFAGSQFHRIIKDFMIQGGDVVNGDGTGTASIYGQLFEDENFNIKHSEAGIVSMANSGPDTNGCQFFVTSTEAPWLDGKHVAFGKVLSGMEVVKAIEEVPVDDESKPVKQVVITSCGLIPAESFTVPMDTFNLLESLFYTSIPVTFSVSILTFFYWTYRKLAFEEISKY